MKDFEYKPARDLGAAPAERLKSLQRETGLTEYLTQSAWRLLVRFYLRTYHRLEIIGAEHIPSRPPFLLVANHSSHLDALVLAAALPIRLRQFAFPIAAGDVFFETPAASYFSAFMLNALPMWRKKCGPHAMATLRERLLADPAIYILFPEGTRSRDGAMGPFKPGIGMIVASSPAPVVPAYLEGAWRAWQPKTHVPRPYKLTLRIGAPISHDATPNDREGWAHVANSAREAVERLKAGEPMTPEPG